MIAGLPQAPSEYNPFLDPKAALQRRNEVLGTMWEQGYITRDRYLKARTSGLGLEPGQPLHEGQRPVPLQPGRTGTDQALRDQHGPQRRAQGLHDDQSGTAGRRRSGGRQLHRNRGLLLGRRPGHRARLGRSQHRRDPRARLDPRRRRRRRIQLRLAGRTAARLLVQALRAGDGDQAGDRSQGHLLRRHLADDAGNPRRRRHLESRKRRAGRRHDVARRSDLAVDQRRLRATRPRRRSGKRHRDGALDGDRSRTAVGPGGGDRRSRLRRLAARTGRRLRDPRQRRRPPRSDRDQQSRIPRRQGRRNRKRRRRTGAHPRSGLRRHQRAQRRDHARATGTGYTNLSYCSEVAGKTGTSEEESDAWFVGYTPEFSTAVWVGHPESRETTGFGGPTAGPIWRDYMEAATAANAPPSKYRETLPELSALTGGHTASGVHAYKSGRNSKKKNSKKKKKAASKPKAKKPRRRRSRRRARRNRRSPGRRSPSKKRPAARRRRRRRRLTPPAVP